VRDWSVMGVHSGALGGWGGVRGMPVLTLLLSVNCPDYRQVLECASPLALWMAGCKRKRQRTAALQDAAAPKRAPLQFIAPMHMQDRKCVVYGTPVAPIGG